jgi:hypothetical protein
MTYRIEGLRPELFSGLVGADEAELAARGARRVRAGPEGGFPCRISLRDAREGASLLLLNFVSHDVANPFRTAYAIYVDEAADRPAVHEDQVPEMLGRRHLGLRGFDRDGMLRAASLAAPGTADREIRGLFERPEIASIHAHNAAHGCFLAAIERS